MCNCKESSLVSWLQGSRQDKFRQMVCFGITCAFFLVISFASFSSWPIDGGWTWKCDNDSGKCKRLLKDTDDDDDGNPFRHTSPKTCRLTCGQYGALWPQPTLKTSLSRGLVEFHPSAVRFSISNKEPKVTEWLEVMTEIFQENILAECAGSCNKKNGIDVIVYLTSAKTTTDLTRDTDESYHLRVTKSDNNVLVGINAATIFGLRHGLETLSQLIALHETHSPEREAQGILVIVSQAEIHDKPTYPHRGLLLDTSRNYLPLSAIKRQINAMAASKLNVLHWHATDSQSFPIVSVRVPQLSRYGAYSPQEVYTLADVRHLLHYAKLRGVRIILEIDSPSHAGFGWQWGNKEGLGDLALCVNKQPWRSYCIQPPCGQLNPVNDNLYKVLGDLYQDIVEVFPKGELFHMGGDEVFIPCWNSSEEIFRYLQKNGMDSSAESYLWLWGRFQEKALRAFDDRNGQSRSDVIVWSSALTEPGVIENYLNSSRYIIQTWVPSTNSLPLELLKAGYRLIVSTKDAWYLDHGFWGTTMYHDWRTVYKNEIPRHVNVTGGEVCMWGELVDGHSIDSKVWPRAAAAAERLWSDPYGNTISAEPRFFRHRERLVTRGIQADAVAPRWCVLHEGECS